MWGTEEAGAAEEQSLHGSGQHKAAEVAAPTAVIKGVVVSSLQHASCSVSRQTSTLQSLPTAQTSPPSPVSMVLLASNQADSGTSHGDDKNSSQKPGLLLGCDLSAPLISATAWGFSTGPCCLREQKAMSQRAHHLKMLGL